MRSGSPYTPLILAAPFMLAVGAAYAVLPLAWDGALVWSAVGLGALGWAVALAFRAPVALLVRRRYDRLPTIQRAIASASGPLEEPARLIVLLLIGRDLDTAYSIGLGWAGIEILYGIVNGFVLASIRTRTDEKAVQARRQLEDLGLLRDFPAYAGVVERITASAFHIGSTLLLAQWPVLLVAAVPVHSGLNLGFLALLPRSLVRAQVLVGVIGLPVLAAGLVAAGAF